MLLGLGLASSQDAGESEASSTPYLFMAGSLLFLPLTLIGDDAEIAVGGWPGADDVRRVASQIGARTEPAVDVRSLVQWAMSALRRVDQLQADAQEAGLHGVAADGRWPLASASPHLHRTASVPARPAPARSRRKHRCLRVGNRSPLPRPAAAQGVPLGERIQLPG